MSKLRYVSVPVEKLKEGNHFFGFVPNNIGEMVYCDSSNIFATKEESHKTQRVVQWIFLVSSVGWSLLFYYLYTDATERLGNLWLFFMIVSIITACVSLFKLLTPVVFKGIDYFVGKEGFALIHFKGSRTTFVKNEIVHFRDIVSFSYKSYTTRGEDSSTIYTYQLKVKDPCGIIVEQEIKTEDKSSPGDTSFDYISDCASRFWKRAHEEWQAWQSRNRTWS